MSRPTKSRGFTLVELMVSLVAGLIVTTAVVGIAKAATTTFFEAARMSSTQAGVRTASERLRQDLARAAYMSTGNIKLARDGQASVTLANKIAVQDPKNAMTGSRYAVLNDLQGVHIIVGGSNSAAAAVPGAGAAGVNNLSTNNGLDPDAILLGGNFTTDDSYTGIYSVNAGACGGSQSIAMNSAGDAAVQRLLNSQPVPLNALRTAFQPLAATPMPARVVDARGCQNYVVVTGVAITATGAQICLNADDSGNPSVLDGSSTACGAKDTEPVTINPVQIVRWYIGPNTATTLQPASGTEDPTNKFNLYRDVLDAQNLTPIPQLKQIISEYAIDLKFGVTALNNVNQMNVYEMGIDPANITAYTQPASGTLPGQPGPQRVRSVRYRISTRTGLADRNVNLPGPALGYLTRYCVQNTAPATCTSFARARTLVSEVTLMNQLGMTY